MEQPEPDFFKLIESRTYRIDEICPTFALSPEKVEELKQAWKEWFEV